MEKGLWVSLAVIVAFGAFPAASASEEFAGRSAQGKQVRLFTHPNGKVRHFSIRWHTHDCEPAGRMGNRWTGFIEPLDRSRPGFFADRGHYDVEYTDADVRFVTAARGRQSADGDWHGTFRIKALIDRPDGPDSTCRVRRLAWRAS